MKMKDSESVKDYSSRLTNKLYAQEQRVLMRGDEATEGAFQANHKGMSSGNLQGKKFFKNNKRKAEGSSRKKIFHLALIVAEPTMLRKIVSTKVNLLLIVISAINLATVRSITEQKKIILVANTTICKCD